MEAPFFHRFRIFMHPHLVFLVKIDVFSFIMAAGNLEMSIELQSWVRCSNKMLEPIMRALVQVFTYNWNTFLSGLSIIFLSLKRYRILVSTCLTTINFSFVLPYNILSSSASQRNLWNCATCFLSSARSSFIVSQHFLECKLSHIEMKQDSSTSRQRCVDCVGSVRKRDAYNSDWSSI